MVKNFGYSIAIFCMRCSSSIQSALSECPCKNSPHMELKSPEAMHEEYADILN